MPLNIEHRVPIQIVIVEDQAMVRAGLRLLLDHQPHLKVTGEVGDFEEVQEVITQLHPDIVLLDLWLNETYVLPHLAELSQLPTRIIVLTADSDEETHQRALELGAKNVVIKGEDPKALLAAIDTLIQAEINCNAPVAASDEVVPGETIHGEEARSHRRAIESLTTQERTIITLVGQGHKDDETAAQLGIQASTLRTQLSQIYHKLGVTSRLGLVVYAYRHHLAAPPQ
jgi:DNA-binding NarL/FixJ family response regulator